MGRWALCVPLAISGAAPARALGAGGHAVGAGCALVMAWPFGAVEPWPFGAVEPWPFDVVEASTFGVGLVAGSSIRSFASSEHSIGHGYVV